MQCYFLVSVDEHGNVVGPVSLNIPGGRFIVLFQDDASEYMDVIGDYVIYHLPKGHGIRSAYFESSSFEETVLEFREAYVIPDSVSFIMDSDPFFVQLVASLR